MSIEDDGNRAPLVQTGEMPPEPPVVRVNEVILDPFTSFWIVDGSVVRQSPESDDQIVVPQIASDSNTLVFEVGHPTVPAGMYVELFAALDEQRHPTALGRRVDCAADSEECAIGAEPDHLTVTVRLAEGEQLAVLSAYYTILPEVADRLEDLPAFLTASWGVTITG